MIRFPGILSLTPTRNRTIEEYLDYDDGTDRRYELVDGELVELPTESTLNTQIAIFLIAAFLQLGIPVQRLGIKQQVSVSSRKVTAREPDFIVHSEESVLAIEGQKQALLTAEMPPPLLVVEIVSPGEPGDKRNYDRDYVEKPQEYASRGIPEFWQVDPTRAVVTVLNLIDGAYQSRFRGSDPIVSLTFLDLQLTAAQILKAGR